MISGFFLVGFFTSVSVEFIKEQSEFLDSMKYICCLYLLYLSYMIAKEEPGTYTENTEALESPTQFKSGFVLQFINGKVILYYIILMTVYASRLGETYSVKFGILLGATVIGIAALSTWTTLGVFLRQYLSDEIKARRSNYILGFLLTLVALDLAFHDELLSLRN